MRVMITIKSTPAMEAGELPTEEMLAQMGVFNEELVKAGIMLDGEGLKPTKEAKRVVFSGNKTTVVDGPFVETKELIAGFWIWQVKSIEEAVQWVRRVPNPGGIHHAIDIRPVFEAEDFGEEFTPELRAQEDRLREQLAQQKRS